MSRDTYGTLLENEEDMYVGAELGKWLSRQSFLISSTASVLLMYVVLTYTFYFLLASSPHLRRPARLLCYGYPEAVEKMQEIHLGK